ncbi:MAG: tetratricopeptide repeat protein [Cyclobacteriaceae bacterium]|nr:tetratricopeptide repeat protein [Cyclobacteriaceae bacterium]
MKRIVVLLFAVIPALAIAQIKPSLPKAEKALREGKIDEAKAIIDATVGNQEFMVDKKGQPAKNAAKAWFLKGIIYAAIDTTKKEQFKSLDTNAFASAKEAFEKSKQLDGDKTPSFVNDPAGFPMINDNVKTYFAQKYFEKAVAEYQEKKNYKRAFELTEQTLFFIPNDTSILMNAGIFFGPSAEEYQKSIDYIKQYQAKGGKSSDAYVQLFSIYRDKLKNNEMALEVAKEAVAKFPNNQDFPKYELDMYIKMNRLEDAKVAMEKQAKADPNDKESRYFLGVINMELKNTEEAKRWYNEAIKTDPKYFEPHLGLAELIHADAKKVKQEMNNLGNSKDDFKKKLELDKTYQEKLRVSLPYWEACEKLSPDEAKVLDTLYLIYTDLEMTAQATRIEKRMKSLGLLD